MIKETKAVNPKSSNIIKTGQSDKDSHLYGASTGIDPKANSSSSKSKNGGNGFTFTGEKIIGNGSFGVVY